MLIIAVPSWMLSRFWRASVTIDRSLGKLVRRPVAWISKSRKADATRSVAGSYSKTTFGWFLLFL
jgi:hypothetical protein